MALQEFYDEVNKQTLKMQEQGAQFLKEAQERIDASTEEVQEAASEWMAKTNEWFEESNKKFDEYYSNLSAETQKELDEAAAKWNNMVDEAEAKYEQFDHDFKQFAANEKADAAEALSASLLRMSMKLQSQATKAAAMAVQYRNEANGEQTA